MTLTGILLAIPAMIMGFLVGFLLSAAITSLAFWTTRVYSIHEFYYALILLFSGQFVPLTLMPKLIQDIAQYLPFQLLIYFPIQLILGKLSSAQIMQGYVMRIHLADRCHYCLQLGLAQRCQTLFGCGSLTMNTLKLLSAFLKVNIQMALAYRADTVVNILLNLMWLGWELLSLNIIFSNTDTIGGWGFGELIALLGVFRLVNTLMIALIWPNTEKFNQSIRDGSMDYTLLQPVNSMFLVTFSRITVWRVWDLVLGSHPDRGRHQHVWRHDQLRLTS